MAGIFDGARTGQEIGAYSKLRGNTMDRNKRENGFTLIEVMMVVVILVILAAVATPKYAASGESARKNADIATAHEVKTALDRYQVENGIYPKPADMTATNGSISATKVIPAYISKLDTTTTQQRVAPTQSGFGVVELSETSLVTPSHVIMIYLSADGSAAEVRVYDENLVGILWSSI